MINPDWYVSQNQKLKGMLKCPYGGLRRDGGSTNMTKPNFPHSGHPNTK